MGKSVPHGPVCLSGVSASEEGTERVENEPHDRRPRTSVTEPNIDGTDALIRENRRTTINELGAMLSIGVGSVEDIVKYHLHYRTVGTTHFNGREQYGAHASCQSSPTAV